MIDKLRIITYLLYYRIKKYKNRKALERFQNKKIEKQLKFVTENSKFYKDYKGKKLEEFPIINKKIMMDNFNLMNTVRIDKQKALNFAIECEKNREFTPKLNNITIGLSSGTSNTRGVFLVSNKEQSKWAGYIISKCLPKNLLKKYKIAFFMRADSNLYESIKSKSIVFEFFDIFKPMEENIEKLNKFNADILIGQPSVLIEICRSIETNKIRISPKKVISIAEVLEKNDEKYIKKILNINVIHQVYQCTEGCLATTCKYGKLHLNEDVVYVEKEYIDKERFIPIITDFVRTSQPIIRYRLNDILVEQKEACKCGSHFTVLKKIEGREDDVFVFKDKNQKEIKVYPDFIRRCMLFAGDIEEYRVIQQENRDIIIYINETSKMEERIRIEFEKLAKEMNFELPYLKFMDYTYDRTKKLKRIEKKEEKVVV